MKGGVDLERIMAVARSQGYLGGVKRKVIENGVIAAVNGA